MVQRVTNGARRKFGNPRRNFLVRGSFGERTFDYSNFLGVSRPDCKKYVRL